MHRTVTPGGGERDGSWLLTRTVGGHEGGRPPGPLPAFPWPVQLRADAVACLRPQVHQGHVLTGVHWGRGVQHTLLSPSPLQKPPLPLQPLSLLPPFPPPLPSSLPDTPSCPSPPSPQPPLTHDGGPGHGAVLGPVVQADGGDGSVPREGDQRRDQELAALLGQEPGGAQGHWGHCQETWGKAGPRRPTRSSETWGALCSGHRRHF